MNQPDPVVSKDTLPEAEAVPPSPLPDKTFFLRQLNSTLAGLVCLSKNPGAVAITTKTVNTAKATIRAAEPLAAKTEVENTGDNLARIYEGGFIVSMVPAGATKELPERARLLLEGDTLAGSSYLIIRTHKRSGCGETVEFMAPDEEPVGSFLL